MGCNSSTTASQPGPAGGVGKKGILSGTVKYTYFNIGYGRADPLEQMFSHHGQPHEKVAVAPGAGPTSEFGTGLPQIDATIGGKNVHMGQLGAMLRSFGIRYGYYNPKDWKQARYCDPIVDCWADIMNAVAGPAFNQDPSKTEELVQKMIAVFGKFMALCEKQFTHHGGKYIAGNNVTIADFILCSFFGNLVKNAKFEASPMIMPLLDDKPKLKAYAMSIETNFPHLKNRGEPAYPF